MRVQESFLDFLHARFRGSGHEPQKIGIYEEYLLLSDKLLERWNNTLRQRLARFVRMTLSFSRVSGHATPACLLLFLHR